jgi:hypothetical protein
MTVDKERPEQKLGEAIGLEMAAQKAVEELSSKGLLPDQGPTKKKLEGMRKETSDHQTRMEDLVAKLANQMESILQIQKRRHKRLNKRQQK